MFLPHLLICLPKTLKGSKSSHVILLCRYSGILHFNTVIGEKHDLMGGGGGCFKLTCRCCTQSRRDGRSSPGRSPPRPPQIPCSCCRECREASGSPGGTDSHRSSGRSRSEPCRSHKLHARRETQLQTEIHSVWSFSTKWMEQFAVGKNVISIHFLAPVYPGAGLQTQLLRG